MTPQSADLPSATTPRVVSIEFGRGSLRDLRRAVADIAHTHGLRPSADSFVLAVHEVVANAIVHGGGHGHLRLWAETGQLRCRVTDHGPGFPTGHQIPTHLSPSATGGRGLWLARQVCHLEIHTGPQGTTIDLTTPIPASPHHPSWAPSPTTP